MIDHPGRRAFLRASTAIGALLGTQRFAPLWATAVSPGSPPSGNRAPLAPQPFQLLPTGSIRPAGWLKRQLQIQASGMGGRLDETWPDVGPNSGWLGGTGENWERGPYFLDGLLPLAWQLDDAALKAKAQRFIDWTLSSAQPNGMFGPANNDDWWPRMVMLKVLTQYHELTGDARVLPLMTNYFAYQLSVLPARPLKDWGRFRWQDEVASIVWLYNRTGDARLLELAALLKQQGFDWQGLFADYPHRTKTTKAAIGMDKPDVPGEQPQGLKDPALSVHGVNNAQALKVSPIWSVVSGSEEDRAAVHRQLAALDEYHGLPIGMFAADEHLAGRSPSQGSNCAQSWRRCIRSSTRSRSPAIHRSATASSALPITRCPPPSRTTCGRTSTTSSPTRCSALAPRGRGRPTVKNRTCLGWSRISAAAPPTFIRAGLSWLRASGWRLRMVVWRRRSTALAR
jgi:hypothetical protein